LILKHKIDTQIFAVPQKCKNLAASSLKWDCFWLCRLFQMCQFTLKYTLGGQWLSENGYQKIAW